MNNNATDKALRSVLSRHLSQLNVDAILRKVYQDEALNPQTLTPADLEQIFQNSLFSAVRMFCDPRQLTTVMLDLADLVESIPESPGSIKGASRWT